MNRKNFSWAKLPSPKIVYLRHQSIKVEVFCDGYRIDRYRPLIVQRGSRGYAICDGCAWYGEIDIFPAGLIGKAKGE